MGKAVGLLASGVFFMILTLLLAGGTFDMSATEVAEGKRIVEEILDGNRESGNNLPEGYKVLEKDLTVYCSHEWRTGKIVGYKNTKVIETDDTNTIIGAIVSLVGGVGFLVVGGYIFKEEM